jgi:hypothetical protein
MASESKPAYGLAVLDALERERERAWKILPE